ncbi:benzoate-CoA ligase family protein [Halobellus sp. Atlit-38R]|uniref:acyl-CoA synthetase n=1 Tax=Halobellus sp. Atlit-38R TaxID=2282131 RepID=UPI000EF21013|nr:acyl-CoA synthetase [Halobellus sp. Atlit-38R]RLM88525.1 benzoate-CoA ligase family protein [Halobellus sp. Atlit-38R]
MQENIPESYLPDNGPQLVHALPELHYPEEINVAEQLVDRHVEEGRGDNVAIRFEDQEITYTELQERVNRLGNAFLDQGVEPGDRVVVRFTNRPEAVISCLAAQKVGAVALPSMKLLRAKELVHIINNAEASTVVVYDDLLEEINKALPDLDTVENVIVVQRNGVEHEHADYDELTEAASDELDAYATERDDLALMLYTSGTTGQPKGATHTHRQVLSTADAYARYCLNATEDDVFGGNPPLPFAYGYGDLVTFPLRFGATSSLVENASPGDLLEAVENHGITILCSIPTAYNQMLSKHPDGPEEYDTSSLRMAMSAGEPLTHSTFNNFKDSYGVEIYDGIGTTEMLHIFVSHREGQEIDPGATGYPVPGYECKVIDPDTGEELPRGEAGMLAVRGPTGISYWNRPEKQDEALVDGWSLPGDIYVHREDGRLEYKSREDDLIISSGYNIPGPEVEAVLEEREEVSEVAVIGAPDEERGQVVKAYVVVADGAEAGEELTETLQNHVKNTLAPYKYPRRVEYVDELPRTETGKIQRVKLRERARDQYEQ